MMESSRQILHVLAASDKPLTSRMIYDYAKSFEKNDVVAKMLYNLRQKNLVKFDAEASGVKGANAYCITGLGRTHLKDAGHGGSDFAKPEDLAEPHIGQPEAEVIEHFKVDRDAQAPEAPNDTTAQVTVELDKLKARMEYDSHEIKDGEIKTNTLTRLADLMEPGISQILNDIAEDLRRLQITTPSD